MEEKSKRGEKSKNKAKRGNNTMASGVLILLVIFLLGLGLTAFFLMQPSREELEFQVTRGAIQTQNAINSTLISASATAFITTATAEAAQGQ
jgi:ABC-type Fe3+ transport system permease subunit